MSSGIPTAAQLQSELKNFVYKPPATNKFGGKSVYINKPGGGISKHRFQTTKFTDELCTTPFGVSDPYDGDMTSTRRNLELNINDSGLTSFLHALDEQNKSVALHNARVKKADGKIDKDRSWFPRSKKDVTADMIDDRYKPLVKKPDDEKFSPTVRVKVNISGRNAVKVFKTHFFTNENGCQKLAPLKPGTPEDIKKHSRVVASVEISGLWFTSAEFGCSLNATHVIVVGGGEDVLEDPFNFGDVEVAEDDDVEMDTNDDIIPEPDHAMTNGSSDHVVEVDTPMVNAPQLESNPRDEIEFPDDLN